MLDPLIADLPENVGRVLKEFLEQAIGAFGGDLSAAVLYGSGAEGSLRPTSDVNLLLVLSAFDREKADRLREPLRLAYAAVRLRAMFLLESELSAAASAFAVKFSDIVRRHRVLYGADPFADLRVSRGDSILRLRQTLLNLTLRLRESYIARGLREEQLINMIAEAAGPLRSCAATLLELEGRAAASPREALALVASELDGSAAHTEEVSRISEVRREQSLPPGQAAETLFRLMELARSMRARADQLEAR